MNRSRKAARYGRLAEEAARARYDLESEHTSWYDAIAPDGRPVETKAAMLNRARGKGRFRVFENYHRRLQEAGGLYVFVAYEAAGRGIRVQKMRAVEASNLNLEFYGAGGHRSSRQAKIPVRAVFR
jgi:hypothetical protein